MQVVFFPKEFDRNFELSLFAYFSFVLFIYQATGKLEKFQGLPLTHIIQSVYPDLLQAVAFFAANAITLHLILARVVWRCVLVVIFGAIIVAIQFFDSPQIIDPVWFFIICASCAFVIALYRGDYLKEEIENLRRYKYSEPTEKILEYLRDSHKFIMRSVLQAWLALGASLGVSMTILFRQGWDNPHLKYMAVKMVVGFGGITFAIIYWIAIPLANNLFACHKILTELEDGAPRARNQPND